MQPRRAKRIGVALALQLEALLGHAAGGVDGEDQQQIDFGLRPRRQRKKQQGGGDQQAAPPGHQAPASAVSRTSARASAVNSSAAS